MSSAIRTPRPTPATPAEPGWRDRLNQHPMAPYHLILGSSMLLLVLGLVMVLSSSSVESYDIYQSAFTLFSRQALFVLASCHSWRQPVSARTREPGSISNRVGR